MLDRSFLSRGANNFGNSSFLQSSAGFSQKRHSCQFGSKEDSICANPLLMRGSLNSNYRKNEMIRINRGNKVSLHPFYFLLIFLLLQKILEQLRKVGPAVGTIEEWQEHEHRSNKLKNHLMGFHLERKYKNMFTSIQPHTY